MAIPAVGIVVGILAASGGLSFGTLIRQPEINKLKAEVRKLQEELERMHYIVDSALKDIQILQLKMQAEHNQDLLDELKGNGDADIGKLIYAYGLKEYLEVKSKYLIFEKDITEEEAIFADSFSMFLENKVPAGEEGQIQKQYIKGYLMEKYGEEIEGLTVPNLNELLNQIKEKLEEKTQEEASQGAETTKQPFIPELVCLSLTEEQARFLYSLELLKIEYDIKTAKNKSEENAKVTWRNRWKDSVLHDLGKEGESAYYFIRDAESLYSQMRSAYDKSSQKTWYYLVAFEATLFTPYLPMDADQKSNKLWRGLKLNKDYMKEEFVHNQKIVDKAMLDKMIRTYNNNIDKLTGKAHKIATSILITTVITVATGGAAGGTAIIIGGGALLGGMVGGGATSLTAMILLSSEGYTLRECAKLLTFSSTVLIDEFSMLSTVNRIQQTVEKRISEFGGQLSVLKAKPKIDKKEIQTISDSLKYLEKCNKELLIMLKED
jgi:hypothetical protein